MALFLHFIVYCSLYMQFPYYMYVCRLHTRALYGLIYKCQLPENNFVKKVSRCNRNELDLGVAVISCNHMHIAKGAKLSSLASACAHLVFCQGFAFEGLRLKSALPWKCWSSKSIPETRFGKQNMTWKYVGVQITARPKMHCFIWVLFGTLAYCTHYTESFKLVQHVVHMLQMNFPQWYRISKKVWNSWDHTCLFIKLNW